MEIHFLIQKNHIKNTQINNKYQKEVKKMLIKCDNKYIDKIKDYIGNDYYKCLYLYLDLLEYGCENPNINVWIQAENEELLAVILKYYTGMHIFSKAHNYKADEIVELIRDTNPSIICGEKQVVSGFYNEVKNEKYDIETGWVRKLQNNQLEKYENVQKARKDDFWNIAKLIYEDEDLGSSYKLESLVQQMYERNCQQYTRNYIITENNKVLTHAATGAENEKLAMLSYVITDPRHRGKGLAYKVCSNLCKDLLEEEKQIFLINYSQESTRLYDKLGFYICCEWGKLFLNLKKEGENDND